MERFDIQGDYHTHTTYSHGTGSVYDNVKVASEKGLKEIAITDHGLRHVVFGMRKRKLAPLYQDVLRASKDFPNVKIYVGVEADVNGVSGSVDVKKSQEEWFDFYLAGYHKAVYTEKISDYFRLHLDSVYESVFGQPTKKMLVRNTDAVVSAIEKNPIAVLTHINYGFKVEEKAVAEACAEFGTYLELNGKRINLTDKEFENILSTDVKFIFDSDAHSPERVGDFSNCIAFAEKFGIWDRVVNNGKLPVFRTGEKAGAFRKDL